MNQQMYKFFPPVSSPHELHYNVQLVKRQAIETAAIFYML